MNIKKIIRFCETFNIDVDSLDFYPGWKRTIFMCLSEEDWLRVVPQEANFSSEQEYEEAKEQFQCDWFCFDELDYSFNVY